jgi:glycosyltransferase involved in cell wall biosynthesis
MAVRHQWIIAQIGSRQHYAVARGFDAIGLFKRLYTDVWCPRFARGILLRGNSPMRAFAGRWHPEISPRKVAHQNFRAVRDALRNLPSKSRTVDETYLEYLRIGRAFDHFVCSHLQRRGNVDPLTDAFFGFNTGCLDSVTMLRERGVPAVIDQVDPAKVEEDIVFAEAAKWPGWQATGGRVPQSYWERLAGEWAAADLVLVNSNWSRSAMIAQGVPANKIIVVPLAYEPAAGPVPLPGKKDRPLTVLWLGAVNLRKGIQYLIEAARLLKATDLKFIVAGPVLITPEAAATAPPNMSFLGRITREQTNRIYQQADIFVLPTLSDGFGITQLEAMNRGLPVIATANCGEVVTDGIDGLIVPAADAGALAAAIAKLNEDRPLLSEMSQNAFIRSMQFLLPNQAREVEAAVCEYQARIGH